MYEQDLDKFYDTMEWFVKNINDIGCNPLDIILFTSLDIVSESLEIKEKNLLIQADKTNGQPFTSLEVVMLDTIYAVANSETTMFRPNDMNITVEKNFSDTEYKLYIRTILGGS
jgi:hypothetical protein